MMEELTAIVSDGRLQSNATNGIPDIELGYY